jgi:hypothetical protein
MTSLREAMGSLLEFTKSHVGPPPNADVLVVEVRAGVPVDARGRLCLVRDDFFEPDDYESRFGELLGSGVAWINLSCLGLLNGRLVVSVEYQRSPSGPVVRAPSINYSGPPKLVLQHGWDAAHVLSVD